MKKREMLLLRIAWLQSIVATLGSLYFSEIAKYTPCKLCWEQRIAMYPLVIILGVGIYLRDKRVTAYALPLVVIGWLIAAYHNLLNYGVIAENFVPCGGDGASCAIKRALWGTEWLTIPLLSLIAFSVIGVMLLLMKRKKN